MDTAEQILEARVADCDALLRDLERTPRGRVDRIRVLLHKATALAALRRTGQAIDALGEVVRSVSPDDDLGVRVQAAVALRLQLRLAERLEDAGLRSDSEIWALLETVDDFIATVAIQHDPALESVVADLMMEKAFWLERDGRTADVLEVVDQLITRFSSATDPVLIYALAWGLSSRVSLLLDEHRGTDAITAADTLLELFERESAGPGFQELGAIVTAVARMLGTDHWVASHRLYERAHRHQATAHDSSSVTELQFQTARNRLYTSLAAHRLGDQLTADAAMDELHGMGDAALMAIDEAASRFESGPAHESALAAVLLNRIPILCDLDRPDEAKAELAQLRRRFAGHGTHPINEVIDAVYEEVGDHW